MCVSLCGTEFTVLHFHPTGTFCRLKKTTKQTKKRNYSNIKNKQTEEQICFINSSFFVLNPQVSATEPFSRFLLFYPFRHLSIPQFKHSCCPPTHTHVHIHTCCLLGAGQGQNSPPALAQSHLELNVHQKFRNKQTNKK